MGMFTSQSRWSCFIHRRLLLILAWMKLVLDVSFISYHFFNLKGLLELYKANLTYTENCLQIETDSSEEAYFCQVPVFWIVLTPALRFLLDIVFDVAITFSCYEKNVNILIISYGYSALMAVYYLVGFCCMLILHLDHETNAYYIKEYYMTVMPLGAIINESQIGIARVLSWMVWILYVGAMSFYLPNLLRAAIMKMETKEQFVTSSQDADLSGILYLPFKLGLCKMLIVKVVVSILVVYTAYFVTAMFKLHVVMGHMIIVLSFIMPLLMLDAAYNVVLYRGYNKQNNTFLQKYHTYSECIRLVNVAVALGIKYYEFTLCIVLQDYWMILLHNFHIFLVLWVVYVVVHYYVEMLSKMKLAKLQNAIPLLHESLVSEASSRSSD